jgi:hypothetical protein
MPIAEGETRSVLSLAGSRISSTVYKIMNTSDQKGGRSWLWVLLAIPYVALLWLPFYNHRMPSLLGFPFFYWYQLLWVPITSLLLYVVYRGISK